MRYFPFLLFSLACFLALYLSAAPDGPAEERAVWEARVKQVQAGMTRTEVEKLLPPYQLPAALGADQGSGAALKLFPYTVVTTMGQGGSQSAAYYVSPGWRVAVGYDYTGIPRDASGTATGHTSPANRLLAPVTLEYRLEPVSSVVPQKKTP